MNELYAADPGTCSHTSDLKLLLSSFGPFTGRYLANYPGDWVSLVERQYDSFGPIETEKVKTLLRRAKENLSLITRTNLPWNSEIGWLENASSLLGPVSTVFDGLVAKEADPPRIHQLNDLDLPPTSEERVVAIASEYARSCKILLLLSPELFLIDPYLNPLKRQCRLVLAELFKHAAKGKCQRIVIWARASELCRTTSPSVIVSDLRQALQGLLNQADFKPGREIEMILIEDESSQTKMHGRYLLSIKGGIRLDQGFQQLPEGRHVDVGPVGKITHGNLLDIYLDGRHDMRVTNRLSVKTEIHSVIC